MILCLVEGGWPHLASADGQPPRPALPTASGRCGLSWSSPPATIQWLSSSTVLASPPSWLLHHHAPPRPGLAGYQASLTWAISSRRPRRDHHPGLAAGGGPPATPGNHGHRPQLLPQVSQHFMKPFIVLCITLHSSLTQFVFNLQTSVHYLPVSLLLCKNSLWQSSLVIFGLFCRPKRIPPFCSLRDNMPVPEKMTLARSWLPYKRL